MQTQCPHCDTQFRITESQVSTANGFVRCGVCKEVFNALEVAASREQQPSLLDKESFTEHNEQDSSEAPQVSTPQPQLEEITLSSVDTEPEKDEFDFFVENDPASQNSVVPEEFRDSTPAISIANLMWSAGTLLLIATLFVEYIWFNRHQLNQVAELQEWRDELCKQVDCSNIAVRDPNKIELVSRNVYSHPHEKNALMVDITMRNNAEFAQPFPVLQINFSDIRGGAVAARRFSPREYLQIHSQKLNLLQAGDKLSFSMEIADPGEQAKTYEFNFL